MTGAPDFPIFHADIEFFLKAVLLHKLAAGEIKPAQVHAITAIINEAAQRIERL